MKHILLVFILSLSIGCQTTKSGLVSAKEQPATRTLSHYQGPNEGVSVFHCKCSNYGMYITGQHRRKGKTIDIMVAGVLSTAKSELKEKCVNETLKYTGKNLPKYLSVHSCSKRGAMVYFNYEEDLLQR
ncbi:MAG: hypothetical protein OXJ52_01835 [Oligoflexia bacterium]|nr:hypothetical protein [Oligoflexia bacterium]